MVIHKYVQVFLREGSLLMGNGEPTEGINREILGCWGINPQGSQQLAWSLNDTTIATEMGTFSCPSVKDYLLRFYCVPDVFWWDYTIWLVLSICMKHICNAVSFWLLACTQMKTLFLEVGVLNKLTAARVLIYLSVISALAVSS